MTAMRVKKKGKLLLMVACEDAFQVYSIYNI